MKSIRTLILVMMIVWAQAAHAVLTIVVTESSDQAQPIAIVPFAWEGEGLMPENISEIIKHDLQRSGQFKPIDENDMIELPSDVKQVKYFNWRSLGVDHLVIGKLSTTADGAYTIEFRLLDVVRGKQLIGYSIPASGKTLRRAAHHTSDIIYQTITGEKGAFNTRIAYVTARKTGPKNMVYTLEVADSDGYNENTILKSSAPIMSPSWSPDGTRLAYVSFKKRRPEIYVQSIYDGKRELVASYDGINGAPVWSPDGKKLALTLSHSGNPDIYILNLATKALKQITRHWAIDTEPVWTPDGRALIFTSGRSGSPQLYEVLISNGKPKRLTFEGNYHASPDISPDGKTIAMVYRQQGQFRVASLDRKTNVFRVLTDGRLDESPSFAPNGSMLLYASEHEGRGVLAAVSIDGRMRQRLVLSEGDIREPVWGPYIER